MPRHQTPVSPRSSIMHFTVRLPQLSVTDALDDASKTGGSEDSSEDEKVMSPTRRATRAAAREAKRGRASVDRAIAEAGVATARAQIHHDHGTVNQREDADRRMTLAINATIAARKAAIESPRHVSRRSSGRKETTVEELRLAHMTAHQKQTENSPPARTEKDTDGVHSEASQSSSPEKQHPLDSMADTGRDAADTGAETMNTDERRVTGAESSDDAMETDCSKAHTSAGDEERHNDSTPHDTGIVIDIVEQYIAEVEREEEAARTQQYRHEDTQQRADDEENGREPGAVDEKQRQLYREGQRQQEEEVMRTQAEEQERQRQIAAAAEQWRQELDSAREQAEERAREQAAIATAAEQRRQEEASAREQAEERARARRSVAAAEAKRRQDEDEREQDEDRARQQQLVRAQQDGDREQREIEQRRQYEEAEQLGQQREDEQHRREQQADQLRRRQEREECARQEAEATYIRMQIEEQQREVAREKQRREAEASVQAQAAATAHERQRREAAEDLARQRQQAEYQRQIEQQRRHEEEQEVRRRDDEATRARATEELSERLQCTGSHATEAELGGSTSVAAALAQQTPAEQQRRRIDDHEGESALDMQHTDQEWADFDARFVDTNMRIAFSIDTPTVSVPAHGFWSLDQFANGIMQVCGARRVQFQGGRLQNTGGPSPLLIGNPLCQDRYLWMLMRRGYVRVHGITIWMWPLFTGRQQSNLELIELEYRNPNHLTVNELHTVLNHWGALEALVVSHGPSNRRRTKWSSIMCINDATAHPTTGEISYDFRLCFEDAGTANRVYSAFLRQEYVENMNIPHARTIDLQPVVNAAWCPRRQQMIRPTAPAELQDLDRRLHIFGFRPELTCNQVEQHLAQMGYNNVTITVLPGRTSGVATTADPATANRLVNTYGPTARARIAIGNIRLFVNRPGENGGMRCFGCGQTGHFSRACPLRDVNTHGGPGRQLTRYQPGNARTGTRRQQDGWPRRGQTGFDDQGGIAQGWNIAPVDQRPLATGNRGTHHGLDPDALIQQAAPFLRTMIAEQVREQTGAMVGELRAEVTSHARDMARQIDTQASEITAIRTAQTTAAADTASIFAMLSNMQQYFGRGNQAGGAGPPQ